MPGVALLNYTIYSQKARYVQGVSCPGKRYAGQGREFFPLLCAQEGFIIMLRVIYHVEVRRPPFLNSHQIRDLMGVPFLRNGTGG
jgi:hypothetical protein